VQYSLTEGMVKGFPFITSIFVASIIGATEFGKYSILLVTFEIALILTSINIQATTRIDYFKLTDVEFWDKNAKHFQYSIIFMLLTFFLLCFFTDIEVYYIFFISLAALIRSVSLYFLAYFQCQGKVLNYSISNLCFVISLSFGIVAVFYYNYPFIYWVYTILTASILQCLISIHLFKKDKPDNFLFNGVPLISCKDLKVLYAALLFTPQAIAWWLRTGAERIVIANELSHEVLGNYALAVQISSIIVIIVSTVNLAVVPSINAMMKNSDTESVFNLLHKLAAIVLLLSVPFLVITTYAVDFYFNSKYVMVSDFLFWVICATLPQAIMMLYVNVLYYFNKSNQVALIILVGYGMYIMSLELFLYDFGMDYLFSTLFFVNSIMCLYVIYISNRCLKPCVH
jgi:O-antigen/teichoic acid export membrane protein